MWWIVTNDLQKPADILQWAWRCLHSWWQAVLQSLVDLAELVVVARRTAFEKGLVPIPSGFKVGIEIPGSGVEKGLVKGMILLFGCFLFPGGKDLPFVFIFDQQGFQSLTENYSVREY